MGWRPCSGLGLWRCACSICVVVGEGRLWGVGGEEVNWCVYWNTITTQLSIIHNRRLFAHTPPLIPLLSTTRSETKHLALCFPRGTTSLPSSSLPMPLSCLLSWHPPQKSFGNHSRAILTIYPPRLRNNSPLRCLLPRPNLVPAASFGKSNARKALLRLCSRRAWFLWRYMMVWGSMMYLERWFWGLNRGLYRVLEGWR